MARLTTVHVSTQRTWHGGEEQAALLVRGLESRGHRAVIFARRGGQFALRMAEAGHEVRTFAGRGRSPRALWNMRRWLGALRPDVLHLHDSHALGSCGLAAWGLPIPARVVARKVVFPLRSSWCYRHFAQRVIAVSEAVARECRQGGVPAERICVVHDGVDPLRIASGERQRGRRAIGAGERDLVLLTVASLTAPKGHTTLLDALPTILVRHPQVRLVWAGDGPLRAELQTQAEKLRIAGAVQMLGHRSDVPDLLRAADLLVAPSHAEGLCSTLIDAMFAGVPIVTTTAGGIPELVGALQPNGGASEASPVAVMTQPGDAAALAAAILHAIDTPHEMQALAAAAHERAREHFTADRMVAQTLRVYEGLLSTGSAFPRLHAHLAESRSAVAERRTA